MDLTDIDTALFLGEFKEKFFNPMEQNYEKQAGIKDMPPDVLARFLELEKKVFFLRNFIASIEGTLEQNEVLRRSLESV